MTNKEYLNSLDDEIGKDVYFYHSHIDSNSDIFTVGCEISQWDGEKILKSLTLDEIKSPDGLIIFNTCAVTEAAKLACERITQRIVNLFPKRKFFFTGCGVDYAPDFYKKYGQILKNADKFKISNYGCKTKNTKPIKDNKHREVGFVKIQDGCYNNCAYCIIHKIRPHYMVPYKKIQQQIESLLSQGKYDIQLLGTEISTYNYNGLTLSGLCERILKDYPDIRCIVIGALDPAHKEIDKLIELAKKEPRIFNSFYLCTQSCCDTILKNMRRRHNVNRLRELKVLAEDKIDFVYQLIIGFPGETDELFNETAEAIKELKPIDIDTIPFSKRKDTDAYSMPNQIDKDIIIQRENILYEIVKEYSSFEDKNSLRCIKPMTKRNFSKFMEFNCNDLRKLNVLNIDLYGNRGFEEATTKLLSLDKETLNNTVIHTQYRKNADIYDLDVNIKLLTSLFGVRILMDMDIDDDTVNLLARGYYTPENFAYRFCVYLNFNFKKLNTSNKDDVLNIFKSTIIYRIEDATTMLEKLLTSGNKEYYDYIVKNLDINI